MPEGVVWVSQLASPWSKGDSHVNVGRSGHQGLLHPTVREIVNRRNTFNKNKNDAF